MVVDDFLICRHPNTVDNVINRVQKQFKFGTTTHGFGILRFFGLILMQHDGVTISIDANDNFQATAAHPITQTRCRKLESKQSNFELKAFLPTDSVAEWLEIAASPFCVLFPVRSNNVLLLLQSATFVGKLSDSLH